MGALERHYTVSEIAKMWGIGYTTAWEMFRNEPGVFRFGHDEYRTNRKYMRSYRSLRVPESVMLRVYERSLQKGRR